MAVELLDTAVVFPACGRNAYDALHRPLLAALMQTPEIWNVRPSFVSAASLHGKGAWSYDALLKEAASCCNKELEEMFPRLSAEKRGWFYLHVGTEWIKVGISEDAKRSQLAVHTKTFMPPVVSPFA